MNCDALNMTNARKSSDYNILFKPYLIFLRLTMNQLAFRKMVYIKIMPDKILSNQVSFLEFLMFKCFNQGYN